MSSYAVERNLPIFKKNKIVKQDDKFYLPVKIGVDNYIGVMSSTPRKDYYVYVDSFNDKSGHFKIGRLEYTKVNKLKLNEGDSILIEMIPNKVGEILYKTEFVPSYSGSNLKFTNEEIKMSFFDWINFINE